MLGILLLILLFSSSAKGDLLPSKTLSLQEIHLVRCLTYISQKYLQPGRNLLIYSPAAYRDVLQELIAEIQQTSLWPVFVSVDGNISIPENSVFINRDGSYIILLPDGNFKYFEAEMLGLILDREGTLTRNWNSEARFVVAGTNEISMLQQREIFDFFSKFRIYKCIILNTEYYVIGKEFNKLKNFIDESTGKELVVYTWLPYRSSDRCTEVNDITLLDSWVISAQGHFTKNTDLFPGKISKSLNGCPMKAIVRDDGWYFTTQYINHTYPNGTVVIYITGLEIQLLMLVLQQMNMSFVHVPDSKVFVTKNETSSSNLARSLFLKESYIIPTKAGTLALMHQQFSSTIP
jgi:hypothetical protein